MAWQNALEIMRAGRLTAPYGAPFEVVHATPIYRLRHYRNSDTTPATTPPLLLVPPLMVASEVYDIAPDVSAIAYLTRSGVDVWVVDFGAPEREEGGLERTLDDHVRGVSEAIDQVRQRTGQDVHLAGYSQGGMFAYQAAAYRRSAGIASIITMGSPVDIHRTVPLAEQLVERMVSGLSRAIAGPLAHIDRLPGRVTSTGFKLLSVRKEAGQLVEFVRKLHDRSALEKREARRLFLGGAGFVAWPGPALRKFISEIVVANRMTSGGIVIDGHTTTLADIDSPILYFFGERDTMGRPAAVRGIRKAAPAADMIYEVAVKAGHFGLVVGSTALTVTWPTVVEWIRWQAGDGPRPARMVEPGATTSIPTIGPDDEDADDDVEDDDIDTAFGEMQFDLELVQDVLGKTARAVMERVGDVTQDVSDYLDNLRWQVPRLHRLRSLRDDTAISLGKELAEQAREIPDQTFFMWRDRAFTYADANRRVDAVVRGLIQSGVRPGHKVAVVMQSRPSYLSVVAALSRLGAVAVLIAPATLASALTRALDVGEAERVITDPETVAAVRTSWAGPLFVLGAAHDQRALPPGVVDLEQIDPDAVVMPTWFRPDPGRARDLALVFVSGGRFETPRASRITNRRWAFSALGAAATCTLTNRDTVYCCLPLHHPTAMLVAAGSALCGGARLALASRFAPDVFWAEVRRYGVTVVFYAGEMCRSLVRAPFAIGEQNHPVRLFAGSGMRPDLWRKLTERFGSGVLEFYASTEASAVLANASGEKIGAVGRPLPGSPELAIAAYDFDADDLVRDGNGRVTRARVDQPGMLIARLDTARGIADLAHIAPTRLLRDALAPGDTWYASGDLLKIDGDGDHWFVDRHGDMIRTTGGPVASRLIEDALHQVPGVDACVAIGLADVERVGKQVAAAAFALAPGATLDLTALGQAIATLPDHARPRRLRRVEAIPMTDGFRPLKKPIRDLGFGDGPDVWAWDPATASLRTTARTASPPPAPTHDARP